MIAVTRNGRPISPPHEPYVCDLRKQVPRYHQIGRYWCGPTNIQMARNGYRNPDERRYFEQRDLANAVKLNNTDEGWHCDPQGLRKTINALANPQGVVWEQSRERDPRGLLLKLLVLVDRVRFPIPVLVGAGIHWVLLVEFETDVKPQPDATVTIRRLGIHDSLDYGTDIFRTVSPGDWFDDSDYWRIPIVYPKGQTTGQWKGYYVGVAETYIQPAMKMVARSKKRGRLIVAKAPPPIARPRRIVSDLHQTARPGYLGLFAYLSRTSFRTP